MDSSTDRAVRRGAVAIAITTLLIVTTTITFVVQPSAREWMRARVHWSAPGYTIGAPSALPASWYSNSDYTLVVFATSNCDACRRALPSFRELTRLISAHANGGVRVGLTSPSDDASAYAVLMGVDANRVERFEARGTALRRVPTLLVIDRRGVVVEMKEGVLPELEQHALTEKLKNLLAL